MLDNCISYLDVLNQKIDFNINPIAKEMIPNLEPVMFEGTQIYLKGITVRNKLILSDEKGQPLYAYKGSELVFKYYKSFIDMVDDTQQDELNEWFFNSEYVDSMLF